MLEDCWGRPMSRRIGAPTAPHMMAIACLGIFQVFPSHGPAG